MSTEWVKRERTVRYKAHAFVRFTGRLYVARALHAQQDKHGYVEAEGLTEAEAVERALTAAGWVVST